MYKGSILIVEDEALVALDLKKRLESMGYEICAVAASGEEAIEVAMAKRPNLILMDIQLQGPMNGVQAAAAIRERMEIPVIFLTAYSDEVTLMNAQWVEPANYLLKPFNEREIYVAVEMALFQHFLQQKRRESEADLRQSLFPVVFSALPCLGLVLNAEGVIVRCNPACLEQCGHAEAEIIGARMEDFAVDQTESARVRGVLAAIREQGKPRNFITRCRVQGEETRIAWAALPLGGEGEEAGYTICMGINLRLADQGA